jgi:signal transduction histidine kinase
MAISGQSGTTECADYRGIRVLSSFTKIQVPGLNWFILAEIDKREAMIPVDRLRITILIFTTLTAVAFFILTFLFARHITKPLIKLTKAATSVGAGNLDSKVQIDNNDEIGELAESFNFMTAKLKSQNDQLLSERASRLSSVIDGQEMERQRISREMHDGVGQALSAIGLRLELASRTDIEKIRPVVDQTKMLVDQTIDEVRAICRSLTPPALKEFGPVTAIRRMAEDAAQHAGLQLHFTVNGNLSNPGIKSGTYLYRIAQEAINNVVKHAKAQTIEITISINEQNIEFLCKDDGCGFEASATSAGNGILNMKERALLIDGFFSLNSVAGKGTSIVVKIPLASYGTD